MIEEEVGQIFEIIGQEVVHKADSSIVVNSLVLVLVDLLKEDQHLQKELEDKEERETVMVLRDMMVEVKEEAIVMEG